MARTLTVIEPPSLRTLHLSREIRRLGQFTDLFRALSVHRIRVRYKQSRLGIAWALIQPLSMMLVFALMFSFMGGAPRHGVPYAVFAYAGLLPWSAFAAGLSSATGALTGHAGLLTKVYFPREILPLTYVVAAATDFAIASTALVALLVWYAVPVGPVALWAIPALAVIATFLSAMGLLLSAVQVRYRDVGLAMPIILQVWLFASPILYPLDAVRSALPPFAYAIYLLNPISGAIDTFRRAVVLREAPDLEALVVAAAVTLALLPAAYLYFKYSEQTLADVV